MNNINFDISEFEKSNFDKWIATAKESLKNPSDEKRLYNKTNDGIELKPIYYKIDLKHIEHLISTFPGLFPFLRHNKASGYLVKHWEVLQILSYQNPKDFNDAIINALNNGQDSIKLLLDSNDYYHSDKLYTSIQSIDELTQAFNNLNLLSIPIYIDAYNHSDKFLPLLKLYCDNYYIDSNQLIGGIYLDPISYSLISGKLIEEKALKHRFLHLYDYIQKNFNNFRFITLRTDIYHNCGANASLELALALATAVYYLRIFEASNIEIDKIIPKFILSLGISTDFFNQIAKIRASRILWSKLTQEIGIPEEFRKIKIHCINSQTNKSILDEHTNILRSIIETYASVLGGADAITVLPFDYLKQNPNEFSDRVARNIQLVIKFETLTNRTIDPAGGSYLIEELTYALAEKAWNIFLEIEKSGGIYNNLLSGSIQKRISDLADEQITRIQTRKDSYIGVNIFANDSESILIPEKEKASIKSVTNNSIDDIFKYNENLYESIYEFYKNKYKFFEIIESADKSTIYLDIQKLNFVRLPKFFEELRLKAETLKSKNKPFPKFLILNFGTIEQYMARRDFSLDFMHIGGFETEISPAFETNDTGIENALDFIHRNDFNNVIVCSSDEMYPVFVSKFSKDFKKHKPNSIILLAGYPSNYIDEFKNSGVDDFIHIKSNAYTFLKSLQERFVND